MTLTLSGTAWRKEQTEDLQRVLREVDRDIPLVFVSGNHDVGNIPTTETVMEFCRTWGDDYFSFWVGGVLFLVLNSQFFYDASKCPALKQAQDQWLEQQLHAAGQQRCRHAIVFQHIPLFLQRIDEDDDYFNLTKSVRKEMADKFTRAGTDVCVNVYSAKALFAKGFPSVTFIGFMKSCFCNVIGDFTQRGPKRHRPGPSKAQEGQGGIDRFHGPSRLRTQSCSFSICSKDPFGTHPAVPPAAFELHSSGPGIKAVFSGHYHRNAGGVYQNLDMVVSSAIGCQLGEDTHGLRVVVVTAEEIVHRYYSLDELSEKGIDNDLMDLLKEK
ncbi:Calcineurin-like phosphoesterase domain-containing protein 1 [Tupaia chinensis]|uniref:Calcineurin-like phosphoesterase domain-containing protein 1 n=1 Tax=Tupaia chinensis TaxID=246437 RepID=L9L2P1_TUPCH|nr:Calcineurin-like phosphoesterase domain-containing protein 1 [Tupaia chinensis]